MFKVRLLPKWVFPHTKPSVYDTTSGTAIEMVAKVYNEVTLLQETHNKFIDEINKTITDFINDTNKDLDCFKSHIDKIMHDYISMLDDKIKMQDSVINESIVYIKENLSDYVKENYRITINEMVQNGELKFDEVYIEESEELNFIISSEVI